MRKSCDLDLVRFKVMQGAGVMVPIDRPWVISCSTSIYHNIVSVTVFLVGHLILVIVFI